MLEQISGLRSDFGAASIKFDTLAGELKTASFAMSALTNRMDKFQNEIAYAQASWSDPKRFEALVSYLKKAGLDDQKIILVPMPFLGPGAPQPREIK